MAVRKIQLKNTNGQLIDCLLKTSFLNDLGGLGYSDSVNYISYSNGFYTPVKRLMNQSVISGTLSFINLSSAYSDYRTLTEWIATAETQNTDGSIKLIYRPFGTSDYQMDVLFTDITKGELDVGGFLSCNVTFEGLTPWYSVVPLQFDFSEPTGDYTSQYDRVFSYVYLNSGTSLLARFTLTAAMEGRFTLEATGGFTSPIVELFDSNGNLIGYIECTGASFAAADKLIVSTMPGQIKVGKLSGGIETDLTDLITIQNGVDVYFSIPSDQEVTLRIRASGATNMTGTMDLYTFYKTR